MKTHSADEANELFVLWNRCAGPWTVASTAWNPVYKRAITSMLNCIFHHICRWRAKVLHWRWWLRLVPTWVSQRLATNINQLWGLGMSMVSPVDGQNQAVGINNILYYQCTESAQLCVTSIVPNIRQPFTTIHPLRWGGSRVLFFSGDQLWRRLHWESAFWFLQWCGNWAKCIFFWMVELFVFLFFCCIYCISKIWTMCYHVGLACIEVRYK